MVLYDDKKWMCRLIRTAFILEDDTGTCENVLKQKPYLGDPDDDDSDSFTSIDSFDVRDVGDTSHRRRSNTAIRLEKLEKHRRAHTDTQIVRVNPNDVVKNDLVFEENCDYKASSRDAKGKEFLVGKLLESVPHPSLVPYAQYARFEASCQPTSSCKKISIFLPFLPAQHRNYPLRVLVLSSAKVTDLIGLVLWLTSRAHPNLGLKEPKDYELLIADEDGESESGFPPLERTELVSKFSFHHLALVPCHSSGSSRKDSNKANGLTFLLPNRQTFHMGVSDMEMTVDQLIDQVLKVSGWGSKTITESALSYYLEKLGDPSVVFDDMSLPWPQLKCKEFCLVRKGAKSVQDTSGDNDVIGSKGPGTSSAANNTILYRVMVSGRFNRLRQAFCVLWSGDRMDLEFENKTKSYPLNVITGVKYDAAKMRIVVSIDTTAPSSRSSHYSLGHGNNITMTANDPSVASALYQHLHSMVRTTKERKSSRL